VIGLLEFLTSFYWLLLPQTMLESPWHAYCKKAPAAQSHIPISR